MTFTGYCPFLIYNYFSAKDIEFQFSTLLLLDIARQKVLSKSRRKLKIEILLVESKRRSECGVQQPLLQAALGSAFWRIIIHFSLASGIIYIFSIVKIVKNGVNIIFEDTFTYTL